MAVLYNRAAYRGVKSKSIPTLCGETFLNTSSSWQWPQLQLWCKDSLHTYNNMFFCLFTQPATKLRKHLCILSNFQYVAIIGQTDWEKLEMLQGNTFKIWSPVFLQSKSIEKAQRINFLNFNFSFHHTRNIVTVFHYRFDFNCLMLEKFSSIYLDHIIFCQLQF